MRVVFMGTPDFSVRALDALHEDGHEIVAVYTQPPRPAGRGKKERRSPVHSRAEELNIPVFTPVNFKDEKDIGIFSAHQAEVAVVVAYGLLLPQSILDAPTNGCLNIHASLLPRWRGAAPIHRAIMSGDLKTGICIMQMEAGLDTGPVLLCEETAIEASDTTQILHDRLAGMGGKMIKEVLVRLADLIPVAQPAVGVTYAKKIQKSEAEIDWNQPAEVVDRHIRGLSPFPGAWFVVGQDRLKVLMSEVGSGEGPAGTVLDDGLTVGCGQGAVKLLRLQRAGKGPMEAEEFQRGFPLPKGTSLQS